MKTDIRNQMNAEKPDDVLADLERKHGSQQAKEDRELMKRVVKICERSGNRELLEQAKHEGAKLYARTFYHEKRKPQNAEVRDHATEVSTGRGGSYP